MNKITLIALIAVTTTWRVIEFARERSVVSVARQDSEYFPDLLLFVFYIDERQGIRLVEF